MRKGILSKNSKTLGAPRRRMFTKKRAKHSTKKVTFYGIQGDHFNSKEDILHKIRDLYSSEETPPFYEKKKKNSNSEKKVKDRYFLKESDTDSDGQIFEKCQLFLKLKKLSPKKNIFQKEKNIRILYFEEEEENQKSMKYAENEVSRKFLNQDINSTRELENWIEEADEPEQVVKERNQWFTKPIGDDCIPEPDFMRSLPNLVHKKPKKSKNLKRSKIAKKQDFMIDRSKYFEEEGYEGVIRETRKFKVKKRQSNVVEKEEKNGIFSRFSDIGGKWKKKIELINGSKHRYCGS